MYQNPNQPKKPRIPAPQAPANLEENFPAPEELEPVSKENKPVVPDDDMNVIPVSPDPEDHIATEDVPQPKKRPGRPRGSQSAPRKEPSAPKAPKRAVTDMADDEKKARTAVYLPPKEHKRLKMMCVDNDMAMTDFIASASIDAMYHSYQCHDPACNCEFIVRSSQSDADPVCPMCGGKKLSRPYLP